MNLTFRWVIQHASSCPLFKAGVACCLPTCAQGRSFPVVRDFGVGFGIFFCFFGFFSVSCAYGSFGLAELPFVYKTWVTLVCLLLDTSFGRMSVGALPL